MSTEKKIFYENSKYIISLSENDDDFISSNSNTLGRVRSNFLGTQFKLYDNGLNPKKCSQQDKIMNEIGVILYDKLQTPRRIKLHLPEVKENGELAVFNKQEEGIKTYFNKPPKWNEEYQAHILNFNGRVTQPSEKNFQIIDESNDEIVYMQFGKIGDNQFNLDVQYPFSILQAFGIALSAF